MRIHALTLLLLLAATTRVDAQVLHQRARTMEENRLENIKRGRKGNTLRKTEVMPAKRIDAPQTGKAEEEKIEKPTTKATFPGGEKAIRAFVKRNTRYPKECRAERLVSRATVTISIDPDGYPSNPEIVESSGNKHMDKEAIRVARSMPRWDPATDPNNRETHIQTLKFIFRPRR